MSEATANTYRLRVTDEERMLLLQAMANFSVDRPDYDAALNRLALRIDTNFEERAEIYESIRRMRLAHPPKRKERPCQAK